MAHTAALVAVTCRGSVAFLCQTITLFHVLNFWPVFNLGNETLIDHQSTYQAWLLWQSPPPFVFYVYTHSQEPPLLPPADPKRPQSGSSNLIKVLRTKKLQITLTEVFKSKFKSH